MKSCLLCQWQQGWGYLHNAVRKPCQLVELTCRWSQYHTHISRKVLQEELLHQRGVHCDSLVSSNCCMQCRTCEGFSLSLLLWWVAAESNTAQRWRCVWWVLASASHKGCFGRMNQEVAVFYSKLDREWSNDIVKLSAWDCDATGSKLCLDLSKLQFQILRPKEGQLDLDCCYLCWLLCLAVTFCNWQGAGKDCVRVTNCKIKPSQSRI